MKRQHTMESGGRGRGVGPATPAPNGIPSSATVTGVLHLAFAARLQQRKLLLLLDNQRRSYEGHSESWGFPHFLRSAAPI